MPIPSGDALNVAAELATFRGEMNTGFAALHGKLDLIAQAQDTTAADVADLTVRVSALEARRWPLGSLAALSGVVSAAVAAGGYLLVR